MVAFVVIICLIWKYSGIYSEYIRNVHGCACVFNMVYAEFIWIMYGLTTTFLFLLRLANLWVLFIFLLTGFGVWSFCSASPCLNGLSLSNCWCTAHCVPSLPICTCSSASCAMKSFRAGGKKLIK